MRWTLKNPSPFRGVEVGWDPGTGGYFLQCFEGSLEEAPSVWHPAIWSIHELGQTMAQLRVALPAAVARALQEEADAGLENFPLPPADHPVWQHAE